MTMKHKYKIAILSIILTSTLLYLLKNSDREQDTSTDVELIDKTPEKSLNADLDLLAQWIKRFGGYLIK